MDKNVTIKFQNIRAYKLIFSIIGNIIDNVKDIYVITFMGIVKCYDAMQTLYKMRLSVIKSKCSNRYSKFQREVQIGPQGGIIMEAWQGFKGENWKEKLMCVTLSIKTLLFMRVTIHS